MKGLIRMRAGALLAGAVALVACSGKSETTAQGAAGVVASHQFRSGATVRLPDGARLKKAAAGGMGDAQTIYELDGHRDRFVHVMEMGAEPKDCGLRFIEVEQAESSPIFAEPSMTRGEVSGRPALLIEVKFAQGPLAGRWASQYYVCRNGIGVSVGIIAPALDDDVRNMALILAESFKAPVPEGWGPAPEYELRDGATLTLPRGASNGRSSDRDGGHIDTTYALTGDYAGLKVILSEVATPGECEALLAAEWGPLEAATKPGGNPQFTVSGLERRLLAGGSALVWETTQKEPKAAMTATVVCNPTVVFTVVVGTVADSVDDNMRAIARFVIESYRPREAR